MTLPVKWEGGAEQMLGTTSLEMTRNRLVRDIRNNRKLSRWQSWKAIAELDSLLDVERQRREQLVVRQQQREELDHQLVVVQKQADIHQAYANVVSKLRLLKAQTDNSVSRYECDSAMGKIDVVERLLQLKAKYKPVKKQNDHLKELLQIKKQQMVSEVREQAILNSITRKALNRADFTKLVNAKFPEMADDMIDFYDQQIYQQGTGR